MLSHRILGVVIGIFSSLSRDWIHKTSEAVFARLLYSASVLDLATRVCFFELQETRFGPKKMQEPEVDLLSSTSEAQSASQNAVKERGEAKEAF
jgi:hypothetical protein